MQKFMGGILLLKLLLLSFLITPANGQYHQSYSPPTQIVRERTIFQPIIIQERLQPAFVFQVMTAYSPQSLQSKNISISAAKNVGTVSASADAEERIARRVVDILRGNMSTSSDLPILDPLPSQLSPSAATSPSSGESIQRVVNGLYSRCYMCHSESTMKGGMALFKEKAGEISWAPHRANGTPLPRGLIYDRVYWDQNRAPSMPPGADRDSTKRVPREDLPTIRELSS